jgi:hypothetical protein
VVAARQPQPPRAPEYFFFAWQARGCADLTPERFWSIYQHRMRLALD